MIHFALKIILGPAVVVGMIIFLSVWLDKRVSKRLKEYYNNDNDKHLIEELKHKPHRKHIEEAEAKK